MDPSISPAVAEQLLQSGPLGLMVVGLLWYIGRLLKERTEMVDAHKKELAAERALNSQLQKDRLDDHKALIPLSQSLVTAVEVAASRRRSP